MTVVDTYTLQIERDDEGYTIPVTEWTPIALLRLMAETEENLTDLLPAGYRARIRRWDHPDPEEENPDE